MLSYIGACTDITGMLLGGKLSAPEFHTIGSILDDDMLVRKKFVILYTAGHWHSYNTDLTSGLHFRGRFRTQPCYVCLDSKERHRQAFICLIKRSTSESISILNVQYITTVNSFIIPLLYFQTSSQCRILMSYDWFNQCSCLQYRECR